ncbi:MAG TPA: hypothetical protein VF650_04445 [Allosphingosinicella sp.]|jgi:hypothetical protein
MPDHNAYFEAGRAIGQALLDQALSAPMPKQKAETFIDGILATHPRIKAPVLLGSQQVKDWMAQHAVTAGHMREALTKGRQKLRASAPAEKPAVRLPKKKRQRGGESSQAAKPVARPSGPFESRVVDDPPLDKI